ncbi:MAG: molybdopterin molybdotransferase MoeA [Chloroflexi bacterium]|nr:molybdopterin molybdotransferase MoeA [Chloroflexota bacterium]MCL5108377.1 molybdopterin molybdotransferase MoeA [Chloroflexota bacterium]
MLISVEEALERVLGQVAPLPAEEKPLLESLGQVLAEDVFAERDVPPLDNSAMDGYAVRALDTAGASETNPVYLQVTAEVAAGYTTATKVTEGTAVRIMTGAPLPAGADAVVQFEDTGQARRAKGQSQPRLEQTVTIVRAASLGLNVRQAGEDIRAGQVVVHRGTVLRPAELGVIASLGRETVSVHRRSVVAVLSTGDELVPLGQSLSPGQIYNSNGTSIAAAVARTGGVPRVLGIGRDNAEDIVPKLRQAAECDLLITTGGVSRDCVIDVGD